MNSLVNLENNMRWKSLISLILLILLCLPSVTFAPAEQEERPGKRVWQASVSYSEEGTRKAKKDVTTWTKTASAQYKLITYERVEDAFTWEDARASYLSRYRRTQGPYEGCTYTQHWSVSGSINAQSMEKQNEEIWREAEKSSNSGTPPSPPKSVGLGGLIMHRQGNKVFVLESPSISVQAFHPGARTEESYGGRDCGIPRSSDLNISIGSDLPKGTKEEQKQRQKQMEHALMPQAQELGEKAKDLAEKYKGFSEKFGKNVPKAPPEGVKPGQKELTPEMMAYIDKIMREAMSGEGLEKDVEKMEKSQEDLIVATLKQGGATELGNRKVLQGSRTWGPTEDEKILPPGEEFSVTRTLTWSFSLVPEDVEAVLIPEKGYEKWEPIAGEDEKSVGNRLQVRVVLQKKGAPGKDPQKTAKFKFELIDPSKEKGICMNWPSKDKARDTFDLKIDPNENKELKEFDTNKENAQWAISKEGLRESRVVISTYDWGAYGKLKVTAILDDGREVLAHVEGKPGQYELKIPMDENNNHVADWWEKKLGLMGNLAADSDEDVYPHGDGDKGDGLSLYEEYRGFMIQGKHERTNPIQKDLFIVDRDSLGLGNFKKTELAIHLIRRDELDYDMGTGEHNFRVINFNSGFGNLGKKYVLWMEDGPADGRLGMAEGGPGVPKKIYYVAIDRNACMKSRWKEKEVEVTVAHELAHGVNVFHHGDNYWIDEAWEETSPGNWLPLLAREYWEVAAQGGVNSGIEECIVRYYRADYYEKPNGRYRWKNSNNVWIRGEKYGPSEMPGTVYCEKQDATGVNLPPISKAGNAAKGKCKMQICVNDMKH